MMMELLRGDRNLKRVNDVQPFRYPTQFFASTPFLLFAAYLGIFFQEKYHKQKNIICFENFIFFVRITKIDTWIFFALKCQKIRKN